MRSVLLLFGRGGTTLPGFLMMKIDPDILGNLSSSLKHGSVVITGTNGKTTTSRLLSALLERQGYVVINNRSGSNLQRGLVASYLDYINWRGQGEVDVAVFEVDEADLINVLPSVACRQLVVTNFFRDQLDRYGELMALRDLVRKSVSDMAAGGRVVLNADDPLVCSLADYVPHGVDVKYFGLDVKSSDDMDFAVDVNKCIKCGGEIKYDYVYLSHLGQYRCLRCGFARPELNVSASEIDFKGVEGSSLVVGFDQGESRIVNINLPGLYNAYNALAAMAAVDYYEIEIELIVDVFSQVKPAFGRFEEIVLDGRKVYLMLSKNPSGFNQLFRTILDGSDVINLVFVLNDNYADGRDVSWIWDVDFEKLVGRVNWVGLSGLRAQDMMLRLKYAGLDLSKIGIEQNYHQLVDDIIASPALGPVFVLATYTGMLDFRSEMQKRGLVSGFWED